MAQAKGFKANGTFTKYADKVFGELKGLDDTDSEAAMPLIERCYEASLPHEEAARRIDLHFRILKGKPEVDIYIPNDNPDNGACYHYCEFLKEGQKGVKKINNESMSHPRLRIEHDDGTESLFVGMPFVMRQMPEGDMSEDDAIPEIQAKKL